MAKRTRASAFEVALCALVLVAGAAAHLRAGGVLETVDITGNAPSPVEGQILARVIGIKWDIRSIPVQYSINISEPLVPNPLGEPFLTIDEARAALQASFDAWNQVKTSYIDMRITGTTANPGTRGFDMINELTFRTAASFTAIASSPSVSLIADATLVDGDLIDNDADPDVSDDITVATDVDGDGDLELPAGFYKAGTILDNDVQFNTKASNGFRFTIDPAQADIVTRSVDLIATAIHEFGHSHGLSHSLHNQDSATDGNGATMFPFIDTGDPASELSMRSLHIDDIAYSSYFYPEGSATSGPAALQPGDLAFSRAFGLIRGELHHGELGQPVAGGHVFAIDNRTGTMSAGAFSGTTQLSFDPTTGGLFFIPDVDVAILDGRYEIPLPKGRYDLHFEPVDGSPVPAGSISFTAQIGAFFEQQDFNEEPGPHRARNVLVDRGQIKRNVDLVTGADINIDNFGSRDFVGFTAAPGGLIYAVRIPGEQVLAAAGGGPLDLKAIAFDTVVVDASAVPRFADAMLTTGAVRPDGSLAVNLAHPLARDRIFIGQDNDFAPMIIKGGKALGALVRLGIRFGLIKDLVLVLQLPPSPFPGVTGFPPLIGLDGNVEPNDAPILGFSYVSADGGKTFTQNTQFNFRFSLRLGGRAGGKGETD